MYVNIGLGNEGWWCLQGLGRSSRPYMEISNDDGRHIRFFSKGLTCDFGSKFQIFSKCVYGQIGPGNDVWECFRVVTQWSWPYMKTLCTPSLGSSHHCGTMIGFLVPPSRCYEGITLRLDSAKRYQKPFRGSHQGTTIDSLSPGSGMAHSIALAGTPQGLVTSARVLSKTRVFKRPIWVVSFVLVFSLLFFYNTT